MKLNEYFENARGTGVLATADEDGFVDVALYARPHVINDTTVAFIMADSRSHHNLKSNPHAAYLFMESSKKYTGMRLYLTKTSEEKNSERITSLRRKQHVIGDKESAERDRYLAYFQIDETRPLLGNHSDL